MQPRLRRRPSNLTDLRNLWISASILLIPSLAVIAPSGYSFGAVALLMGAISFARDRVSLASAWHALPFLVKAIIVAMILYAVVWMTDAALRGEGVREFDRPSRFLFAAFCLLILSRIRLSAQWFWAGVLIGSAGAGIFASWEVFFLGSGRANGTAQTIQFGNITMVLGLMCCAAIIGTRRSELSWLWTPALIGAALLGVLASFLSGTRGAWFLPLIMLPLGVVYFNRWRTRCYYALICLLVLIVIYTAAYHTASTGVEQRVDRAIIEVMDVFSADDRVGSVGYRFEMWRGGLMLFAEQPIFGWGENDYISGLRQLGEQGHIEGGASYFTHAHNDWVNVLAKKGIIGALILAAVYFLPLLFFFRMLLAAKDPSKEGGRIEEPATAIGLSGAGIILVLGFLLAGMTQVSFNHNSGVMIYSFLLAILIGLCCQAWPAKSSQ